MQNKADDDKYLAIRATGLHFIITVFCPTNASNVNKRVIIMYTNETIQPQNVKIRINMNQACVGNLGIDNDKSHHSYTDRSIVFLYLSWYTSYPERRSVVI